MSSVVKSLSGVSFTATVDAIVPSVSSTSWDILYNSPKALSLYLHIRHPVILFFFIPALLFFSFHFFS